MSTTRFIQIHTLTSYSATLLNRDDVGFAKRIPFGGATRTRISSQCLKRHWRTADGHYAIGKLADNAMSVRSRRTFEQLIFNPLRDEGVSEDLARSATAEIMKAVLGESAKAKKQKARDGEATDAGLDTSQVTVLGRPEVQYLLSEARAICGKITNGDDVGEVVKKHFDKNLKKNLEQLRLGCGLDAALFGRMVTSDILSRVDAALHVAHAFTVHAEAAESDYFSVVDDLLKNDEEGELGSGHIGNTELTSGLFYGYVVVDLPLLIENLSCDQELAAKVVSRLPGLIATVSPGAKLGSTAPHAYSHLVLVETGTAQPRTLANAFLEPVKERPNVVRNAYQALASYMSEIDKMYGSSDRALAAVGPREIIDANVPVDQRFTSLADLAAWAAQRAQG